MCVCVCVVIPFILDVTALRTHQPGSHRISHIPSFCGACLNFSREKDSAVLSLVDGGVDGGWLYKIIDTAAESERNPASKHEIEPECGE